MSKSAPQPRLITTGMKGMKIATKYSITSDYRAAPSLVREASVVSSMDWRERGEGERLTKGALP
jgi:hypothetical protein